MKILVLTGFAGLTLASTAAAEPVTRTYTFDGPRYEGSKTVTRDREEGTVAKDWEVTRERDGATASREYDRQRTENGYTASGSRTRFNGDTRSWDYERTRTANGYNAEGSFTRFNGKSYEYDAKVRRGEHRVGKSQIVRNEAGRVVAARRVVRPRRGN